MIDRGESGGTRAEAQAAAPRRAGPQARRDAACDLEPGEPAGQPLLAHGIASWLQGKRIVVGSRHFVNEDEGVDVTVTESTGVQVSSRPARARSGLACTQ